MANNSKKPQSKKKSTEKKLPGMKELKNTSALQKHVGGAQQQGWTHTCDDCMNTRSNCDHCN